MSLDKPYNPKEVEDRIYKTWEESGYFNPDNLPGGRKKTFTIALPPPNVTGSLHMGHALNATIQDILIRRKRMQGYKALWIPGLDHAGIATQNAVEKSLKKQNLTRHKLGKEKFLEKVWEWKEQYGGIILDQLKKTGASLDWSRTRFTMDEEYQKAVKVAFEHYQKRGWLYKAEKVINWCVRCQTSLSDLELEREEKKTKLYYLKYPVIDDGHVVVATTRPETMLGDAAVAVNPKDKRYKDLIGKKILLPIQNREIPIISDREVEMEFGTGAVKVTPAHDLLDASIGERNGLPVFKVIGPLGKMTEEAGEEFKNLKTLEAREKVIQKLEEEALVEKVEDYTNNLSVCYRCNTAIEPMPSLQWFIKMDKLAKTAIKAVKSKKVKFHPKGWEDGYLRWLENIRDWNISRQIWWGHKIPVKGEDDVLDTWFSSALWPFAILGWPEQTPDLKEYYPTQVLATSRDIINLWVSRMVFSSLELYKDYPFSDVIIHATILAKNGQRMSKSLGTGVDPLDLIDKYGADATRFGLIWQAMGAQDIKWDETAVVAGKKFANKFWNISRFILTSTDDKEWKLDGSEKLDKESEEILKKLDSTIKEMNTEIDSYRFGQALRTLHEFIWHDLADKYIEEAKADLAGSDAEAKVNKQKVLYTVFMTILKNLHPFMPFITEEIYSKLSNKEKELLMIEEL